MQWRFDFFPEASSSSIVYSVAGEVLTVNGEAYDFGPLDDGDILPAAAIEGAETWLRSTEVTRWEGALRLCVVLPFVDAPDLPDTVRNPDAVIIRDDGRVPLATDPPVVGLDEVALGPDEVV